MDIINILIVIAAIHCILYFFNTIFVTCMHYPYLCLAKKCGLEIQFLRIKWFTTNFNRRLMKWGLNNSKFWSLWFNIGLYSTILLLPVCIILILKVTLEISFNYSSPIDQGKKSLDLMIPGIDIPFEELGYYIISLILSSFIHELGHAMAAVREDVRFFGLGLVIFFIIPIAFVNINDEQLTSLPIINKLRVLCAGIWHNVVLTLFAVLLMVLTSFVFLPFFKTNNGVFIKDISSDSSLLGPSGLNSGDVVYKINDCSVKNLTEWKYCIIQAIDNQNPGYCVPDKMIKKLDKSVQDKKDSNCCSHYNQESHLCFSHVHQAYDDHTFQTINYCLPTRVIIESYHNLCQNNEDCAIFSDICIKPIIDNATRLVHIQRYRGKDVIFYGHPSEIYYATKLSNWVPRYLFLSPYYPEALILLCKYIAVFSAGLVVINLVPCFYFDGQHILSALSDLLLGNRIRNYWRSMITVCITYAFTLLIGVNLLSMYVSKM